MHTMAISAYIQNRLVSAATPTDHCSVSSSFVVTFGIKPIKIVIARVIPADHLTALPQSALLLSRARIVASVSISTSI